MSSDPATPEWLLTVLSGGCGSAGERRIGSFHISTGVPAASGQMRKASSRELFSLSSSVPSVNSQHACVKLAVCGEWQAQQWMQVGESRRREVRAR